MRHAFVHFDLNTSAFAEVRRFYEALFDWSFVDVDMGGDAPYAQIRPPSGPGGGLQPSPGGTPPSQWVPYVGVDDVRAMLERVRAAGGTVVVDYTPVPGYGAQAIVQDPGGTQIGLWEIAVVETRTEPEPEIVEAEIIEDAEVVEEAAEPEVVVPAAKSGKKKGGRGGKRAVAEEPPVVVVVPEVVIVEAAAEPPAAKKAAKKAPTTVPSAKKASAKKAAENQPFATKKTTKKKTAAKQPPTKKPPPARR
jgi:uncharacterized protein